MTECEKCHCVFEETNMIIVETNKLTFICKECNELIKKDNIKIKPTPVKPS